MRIVFLGTPDFAVPSLRAIVQAGHQVPLVATQPDRPKGRGNILAESPVKIAARELGLEIAQPERVRRPEIIDHFREINPDLMVVVGYGQIIPQSIIDIPPYGILNVHGSLLPKYRGAAPIQWAIANGEQETGVTIMQIDAGLDTGDMLMKRRLTIGPDETAPELSLRMSREGADALIATIDALGSKTARREKQREDEATMAPILKKEDGCVNWQRPAAEIYNRMRGFTPWPGAYTTFRDQTLTLVRIRPVAAVPGLAPGELRWKDRRLFAGCGMNTTLELFEVQPAGKKRMAVDAFVNGYRPVEGEILRNGGKAGTNRPLRS